MRLRLESVLACFVLADDLTHYSDAARRGRVLAGYPEVEHLAPGQATLVEHTLLAVVPDPLRDDRRPDEDWTPRDVTRERRQVFALRRLVDDPAWDAELQLLPLAVAPEVRVRYGLPSGTHEAPEVATVPVGRLRLPRRRRSQAGGAPCPA